MGGWKKTRTVIRCANGHQWPVTAANLVFAGSWCPECLHKGERIVRAIFEATFKGKFPKSKPCWLAAGSGHRLELDGYNKQLEIAFEYQGPHHFTNTAVMKYDALKREVCRKKGVQLIEVEAIKRPFPSDNVLKKVTEAFKRAGVHRVAQSPSIEAFPDELKQLRQLAKMKGGTLVSTEYCGAEKHEWKCANPKHVSWLAMAWNIRRGAWCPSCAGNRPLGIEELAVWGREQGLELMNRSYRASNTIYTKSR